MMAIYSLWNHGKSCESTCYGRYTDEKYANRVAAILLQKHGVKVEIECDFVYTRKYEVEEQINRFMNKGETNGKED